MQRVGLEEQTAAVYYCDDLGNKQLISKDVKDDYSVLGGKSYLSSVGVASWYYLCYLSFRIQSV